MSGTISTSNDVLIVGNVVFFSFTEEHWNKPYTRKSHHEPETRTVLLKGRIVEVKGDQFKVYLFENNGFEKDNEEWVFHKNQLLSDQNFTDFASLGQWKQNPSANP